MNHILKYIISGGGNSVNRNVNTMLSDIEQQQEMIEKRKQEILNKIKNNTNSRKNNNGIRNNNGVRNNTSVKKIIMV